MIGDRLRAAPVLAILRRLRPEEAVRAAEDCWAAGVDLVEVSLVGEAAPSALQAVCARAAELDRSAGAGTVCSPNDVTIACDAGASFAVGPGLVRETIEAARSRDLPYVPGVATPSEVQEALFLGCQTVKVFPAQLLGTAWFSAMRGPFSESELVAVGGVTAANARAFVDSGAIAVGIGSTLDATLLPDLLGDLREALRDRV